MTLYLNKPTYLHNSVHSYFSNLTKALEHQNESDKKIYNYGSSLENHTFDSLTNLIDKSDKLQFIFKKGEDEDGEEEGGKPAAAAAPAGTEGAPGGTGGTTAGPTGTGTATGAGPTAEGGGRVKRTRNLRNRGNNKSLIST